VQADALFHLESVSLGARLRGVTLAIPRGVTAVLGASGAGKTSLLNLLAGFEKPSSGKIHGDTRVAWAPQGDGLWPGCTTREHLTECGATKAAADALLKSFDLAHLADVKPPKLSRGEQSRLALARALAMPPRTLVLDEPLAHVDSARVGRFWSVIREHVRNTGTSLIFATHGPEAAIAEAGHAICLREGSVVFTGIIRELHENPSSEDLASFLGPANWLTPEDAHVWLGESWPAPRCVRPERLAITSAHDGEAAVVASRFSGAFAETSLRTTNGATRTFLHRPDSPLPVGLQVSLSAAAGTQR
jgi:ABC-type sulfate/molybdate transport systems ATPase subunit